MTDTDTGNVKLAIARRVTDRRLIKIRDALALKASGHVGDYTCPYCEARVFTVDTFTDRAVHFRHEHGVECAGLGGGLETWLHWRAKKAFRDLKAILLPSLDADGSGEVHTFASVALEKTLPGSSLRPDAIADDIQGSIAVEFAVTHFCELGKKLEFQMRKLPAIEVDLSAAPAEDMTPEQIDDWILLKAPRKWIASPAIADPESEVFLEDVPESETAAESCHHVDDVDIFRRYEAKHPPRLLLGSRVSDYALHVRRPQETEEGSNLLSYVRWSKPRSQDAEPKIENAKLFVARSAADNQMTTIQTALTSRDSGHAAEYSCPYCRARVDAVRTFMASTDHFRHQEGVRCPGKGGSAETWLNWQARRAFRDRKEILLPPLDDEGNGEVRAFSSVFVSKHIYMSSIRPDAIAVIGQGELAVEFAVVQRCNPTRISEYQKRGYPAVEVNLMASDLYDMPSDELDDWILFKAPRKWISGTPQASANMLHTIPDALASRWARNHINGFGI